MLATESSANSFTFLNRTVGFVGAVPMNQIDWSVNTISSVSQYATTNATANSFS